MPDKKTLESLFTHDFGSPYFPVLADLYMQEGDFRRARLVCEIGLRHDAENHCGKFILAKVALAEEKPVIAEKWLKQAVKDNPDNFIGLRMLIRLEFVLNRSHKTISKYINQILQFLPEDDECVGWMANIDTAIKMPRVKDTTSSPRPDVPTPANQESLAIVKKHDYDIEKSMATFTMLKVLRAQKHYQQALAVLNILESKNMDSERISIERSEIEALIAGPSKD